MGTTPKIEPMKVSKEDFIEFMAHATPEELNDLISTRGKRGKPYCPFCFFGNNEQDPFNKED